ncbi:MAG: hypothetical protein AAF799_22365 [Myxococcota bacterium]
MTRTLVDVSAWPLVVLRFSRVVDAETVQQVATGLSATLDRAERFCMQVDMTNTSRFEWAEIKSFDRFARANEDRLNAHVAALALIIPSAMVRGAIRVMFRLKSPAHPYRVVHRRESAVEYLAPYLAELVPHGVVNG